MPRNNDKPGCPKVKRLRELIKQIDDNQIDVHVDVTDALIWLANFLEDRQLYHKRQQLINKNLIKLGRQHGLLDEAKQAAEPELVNHVLNQSPDEEEQQGE